MGRITSATDCKRLAVGADHPLGSGRFVFHDAVAAVPDSDQRAKRPAVLGDKKNVGRPDFKVGMPGIIMASPPTCPPSSLRVIESCGSPLSVFSTAGIGRRCGLPVVPAAKSQRLSGGRLRAHDLFGALHQFAEESRTWPRRAGPTAPVTTNAAARRSGLRFTAWGRSRFVPEAETSGLGDSSQFYVMVRYQAMLHPAQPFNSISSTASPLTVDGSEHYLAFTLPSREHPSYSAVLDLAKSHGFLAEPSNGKWWLRDRHKTLNFLAAHGARLRGEFGARFTANFDKNTSSLRKAEIVCSAAEAGKGFGRHARAAGRFRR